MHLRSAMGAGFGGSSKGHQWLQSRVFWGAVLLFLSANAAVLWHYHVSLHLIVTHTIERALHHEQHSYAGNRSSSRPGNGAAAAAHGSAAAHTKTTTTTSSSSSSSSVPSPFAHLTWEALVKPDSKADEAQCSAAQASDAAFAAAVAKPVLVSIETGHFFGDGYARKVKPCHYRGCPIQCEFRSGAGKQADALWYHAPGHCSAAPPPYRPGQLRVVMSMESELWYNCLSSVEVMDTYEVEMTYRACSAVQVHYFDIAPAKLRTLLFSPPPVAFCDKMNAVVYINSNCGAKSGRDGIMKALMDRGNVPVHAFGACLRNMDADKYADGTTGRAASKRTIFSKYKFCVTIENSVAKDYVTEKFWDGFAAGCVPIYYGAPNIDDYWPHPDSIVDYRKLGSPEALEAELLRLMHDPQAYEAKLAWKKLPLRDLSPGFLRYVDDIMDEHTQCKLCRIVVQQRVKPRHLTGSHCLRNQSWMASGRSVALPPAPAAKAPAAAAKAKSGGVVTLKKDISGKPGGAECKSS